MNKAEKIVRQLELKPHPEGGFFKETYRSEEFIKKGCLDLKYNGSRNYATCIYFLLTSDTFSAFHRIKQDEIWHFYDGSPVILHLISPDGCYSKQIIGSNLKKKQQPQFVVPGGTWFAATIINKNDYSLLGCTVSPGFDFLDFELAKCNELTIRFPLHTKIISKLTRN